MHAGRGIVVGAATASGLPGGFMQGDGDTGLCEPHSRGKAGEPGADNVNVLDHQTMP
jgi:hypothetical protein